MCKTTWQYVFLCILMMTLIICLIYSSFNMIFLDGYVISINNKNKQEINKLLEKEGIKPENITRLELDKILGDAELRIYNNFKLSDTKKVNEGAEIVIYILEEGSAIGTKYIFYVLILIILIAINKEMLNKEACNLHKNVL